MRSSKVWIVVGLLGVACFGGWFMMIRMPGTSFQGPLPPVTDDEHALEQELRVHVHTLAGEIGERNVFEYDNLRAAATYIGSEFESAGYAIHRQEYTVSGSLCENIAVEVTGTDRPDEIVLIGAHYDSVKGSPGANDNGTGMAAVLALARKFANIPTSRTIRFVAFANEESPFFQTSNMGSWVYAQHSRKLNDNIVLMVSLETIGYYSLEANSQQYPPPLSLLYPSTGHFIAMVSNVGNGAWVRKAIGLFRQHAAFPSEGAAVWGGMPGVGWSDHWAFWQEGFPAIMVTDTALYRDPFYHTASDTPNHIHYEYLARVVEGFHHVIADIANQTTGG